MLARIYKKIKNGFPTIEKLKESFPVIKEEGSPDYSWYVMFDIG